MPLPQLLHRAHWPAGTFFALLAGLFGVLFAGIVAWLAADQYGVLQTTESLRLKTIPQTLEYQRLARNLEVLRREGERVLHGDDAAARQQALFVVSLVASHPRLLEDERARALAGETEEFLSGMARRAHFDAAEQAHWERLSTRLTLLADDISVDGVNLANADLEQMSAAIQRGRYKLAVALLLAGVFLTVLLWLIRRHFIRPLQHIDRALSQLQPMGPPPALPASSMEEFQAIEGAIGQLHEAMRDSELTREDLERLATTDALTGLHNRRHFMHMAHGEVERAHRYGRPVAVGLADLDLFKRVNDTHGHAAGDAVLQAFALVLRETLRQTDWVCRYGGEEFAFAFPETTPAEAQALVERLRRRLAELDIAVGEGKSIRITLSIGLADASAFPLEAALRQADEALYRAKTQGRNMTVLAGSDAGDEAEIDGEAEPVAPRP